MKEWFLKYLGLLGFGVWIFGSLIFAVAEFILNITLDSSILMIGFLIMGGADFIKDILNKKYFTKYSEKVKNGIIIFIVTSTIGMSYFIL
tara:strand:- start:199 stop:468 length:270 start_codon:yes stop_codon:yes gene_type:complete